jgi:hypothetical protein
MTTWLIAALWIFLGYSPWRSLEWLVAVLKVGWFEAAFNVNMA